MKLSADGRLRRVVCTMFAAGIGGSVFAAPMAYAQDAAPKGGDVKLEKVEVTGSRIRRVDSETADLVQVIDRKQIQATGAATLGELLQSVPSVSGTPYNSAVNNGGGDGTASADLRGLGPKRTLILLDGQRLNPGTSASASPDLNAIPANMIERIEVLKEGAGAVYGTDAIGGVINFITRTKFQGVEAFASVGDTEHGGGSTRDYEVTVGGKLGKGFAVVGASFNRQDEIYAGDRPFSDAPTAYIYNVLSDNVGTSSRSPGGRFTGTGFAGAANALDAQCPGAGSAPGAGGLNGVTLIQGRTGTSVNDFRGFCQNNGVGYSDRYNFQPENLALTPSTRYSLFGSGQYPLSDNINFKLRAHYTNTDARAQLAPEPFDNVTISGIYPPPTNPAPVISAANVYNPFGRDITGFGKRATAVGDRIEDYKTETIQINAALKGTVFSRFDWETGFNFGRDNQANHNYGFLDFSKIAQQLGPSFYDATGTARCGTPTAPIPNCTPINVFGTTGATIANLSSPTNYLTNADESDLYANVAGDLFNLPAGAVGFATGFQFRALHYNDIPDGQAQAFTLSENNKKSTSGEYNVREVYAEATIPVLKDLPGAKLLELDLGGRYSSYSTFGQTTDGKYQLQYKPYTDLLVRYTYSDVFRAPTTFELFQGGSQTSPTFQDPCNGLKVANPVACAGVRTDGSYATADGTYQQPNTQANGNNVGNPNVKPEEGFTTDVGLVFSPSFYKPLSITFDYWRYSLKGAIDRVSLQTILNACFANPTSAFCGTSPNGQPYFVRDADGNVANSQLPYVNAQNFQTNGFDLSVKLDYPKLSFGGFDLGKWSIGFDTTYLREYTKVNFDPDTGVVTSRRSLQGQYDGVDTGNSFPHVRLLGYVFWSKGPVSVSMQDRFLSDLREGQVDAEVAGRGVCSDEGGPFTGDVIPDVAPYFPNPNPLLQESGPARCFHHTGSANYVDTAVTYALKQYNTDVTFGVNDLFDDGAQSTYSGFGGAANPIYDVRGRNFYGKLKLTFK